MASNRSPYKNAAGKSIPRVTTVCSRFADKGGIIDWAWKCGMQGLDYRAERDAAGEVGTQVHKLCEAHVLERAPEKIDLGDRDARDQALNAYSGYLKWREGVTVVPMLIEQELISEKLQVGGTLDLLAEVNERCGLVDFKTGKALYPDQLVQQAGYGMLVKETHGIEIDDVHILRCGKEDGKFYPHTFRWDGPEMEAAREFFRFARVLYETEKPLLAAARKEKKRFS